VFTWCRVCDLAQSSVSVLVSADIEHLNQRALHPYSFGRSGGGTSAGGGATGGSGVSGGGDLYEEEEDDLYS